MRILTLVALFCFVVAITAKKQHQENVDSVETESKTHGSKKYSKEHQKNHHHSHKKHEELANEAEPKSKQAPVEVPEPEIELQENLETNKKAVTEEKQKEQMKDMHLQDLAYEESLHKKEKKRGHHGAHRAEVVEKHGKEADQKLFADHESKHSVDEKVIEDSFERLSHESADSGKGKKLNDKKNKESKKNKDKSKNKKKAYEKSKDKTNKKHKDGKKNKDKKNKNKDKKY